MVTAKEPDDTRREPPPPDADERYWEKILGPAAKGSAPKVPVAPPGTPGSSRAPEEAEGSETRRLPPIGSGRSPARPGTAPPPAADQRPSSGSRQAIRLFDDRERPPSGLRPATPNAASGISYLRAPSGIRPATPGPATPGSGVRPGSGLRPATGSSAATSGQRLATSGSASASGLRSATGGTTGATARQSSILPGVGPSSSRISLGVGVLAGHWNCSLCGISITKEGLVQGTARLKDGILTCSACLDKAKKPAASAQVHWGLILGFGLVFVAASFLFPGQILFLLVMAAVGAMLFGALSMHLRGSTRILLLGGGLLTIVAALLALTHLQERSDAARENSLVSPRAAEIRSLLQEDKVVPAHKAFVVLMSKIRGPKGDVPSAEGQKAVQEITKEFDAWFKAHYGELREPERELLLQLLIKYPEKTASGARRFSALRLTEGEHSECSLRAILEVKSFTSTEWLEQGVELLGFLLESSRGLEVAEAELSVVQENGERREMGTYRLPRSKLSQLLLMPGELARCKVPVPGTKSHE